MNLFFTALIGLTSFSCIQGAGYWTRWFDRDSPSGNGDNESLDLQMARGPVCMGSFPQKAECRVRGSPFTFTSTTGTPPNDLFVKCTPDGGVVCRNADQPSGLCLDYEIRYYCSVGATSWTTWFDRDNPSGTGDWESFSSQEKKGPICLGTNPIDAECRVKGVSGSTFTSTTGTPPQELFVRCTPEGGVVCRRDDQSNRRCSDYEIRYLCPSASPWTNWYNRDDPVSDSKDSETLAEQQEIRPVCSGGSTPVDAECRAKGSESVFKMDSGSPPDQLAIRCSPTEGLVCNNEDQSSGKCSDYEIRYLCPVWTQWYDRDNPSGTGDWENIVEEAKRGPVCDCRDRISAQCRVKNSDDIFTDTSGTAPNRLHMPCSTYGLVCRNSDQTNGQGKCQDYEIRYLCYPPEPDTKPDTKPDA